MYINPMDPQKGLIFMSLIFFDTAMTLTPSCSKAGNAAQPAGSNPKATMRRKGNACGARPRGPGMVGFPQCWILTHTMVCPENQSYETARPQYNFTQKNKGVK